MTAPQSTIELTTLHPRNAQSVSKFVWQPNRRRGRMYFRKRKKCQVGTDIIALGIWYGQITDDNPVSGHIRKIRGQLTQTLMVALHYGSMSVTLSKTPRPRGYRTATRFRRASQNSVPERGVFGSWLLAAVNVWGHWLRILQIISLTALLSVICVQYMSCDATRHAVGLLSGVPGPGSVVFRL